MLSSPKLRKGIFFWPFLALLIVQLEECDRKQGKRGGVTCSKGTRAGSPTHVRCRASAQLVARTTHVLSGAPKRDFETFFPKTILPAQWCLKRVISFS